MASSEKTNILKHLQEILASVKDGFSKELTAEDDIRELDLDSLDIINFLFSIEESYGFSLSFEEVEEKNLFTMGSLAEHINSSRKP